MSRRRAVVAMLAVSVAGLAACSSSYDRSSGDYGDDGSAAAVAHLDAGAARIQTGNLPS